MQFEEEKQQFIRVIQHSQGIPEPKVDKLFETWASAKKDFIEAFDGKLIYELPTPVSFELGQKEKSARIDDFIASLDNRWGNNRLANFVEEMRDCFFTNIVDREYYTGSVKIPKGIKLIKSFKYFEDNKDTLTDIQNQASRIIQEDKIEGRLCLSVHPLDFLSVSENSYNWRSCHALDGEYRAGNLSYMTDKSTVVCYLRSTNDEKLINFPEDIKWNSKKWRVLLFFSENKKLIFAGRQYPFSTEVGINFVLRTLLPSAKLLTKPGDWSHWKNRIITSIDHNGDKLYLNSQYLYLNKELVRLNHIVTDLPNSLHFNDLLNSSCYLPIYAYKHPSYYDDSNDYVDTLKVEIGGEVACLRCGEELISVPEVMTCNDCELKYGTSENDYFDTCDSCGCRILSAEGVCVGDEVLCHSCADNYCKICSDCGDLVFSDDAYFNREENKFYCWACHHHNNENDMEED